MTLEISNKIENVVKALTEKGYETKIDKASKNGTEKECLLVRKTDILWAVFYLEVLESLKEEDILEYVFKHLEENDIEFDMNLLNDIDYLVEHMYVGLQRETDLPLVSRKSPFNKIIEYLYVSYNETCTINLPVEVFKSITKEKYTEEEVWDIALKHTCEDAVIGDIYSMMYEDLGISSESDELTSSICIITSKSRIKGAAAVLNKEIIKRYADTFGLEEFYLIPSSVHEVIVLPCSMSKEEVDQMVKDANAEIVSDDIRLGNEAFRINVKKYIDELSQCA